MDELLLHSAQQRDAETVGEVMSPVAGVPPITHHGSTEDAMQLVRRHGYNRLPVYRGDIMAW